ncbi:ribosomal protein L1p/L10e family-domain-containing protein [Flammula alnicola]|nr:ribosomal protein L1p/L10e family-domain-containing protein [Flammula alnicola]
MLSQRKIDRIPLQQSVIELIDSHVSLKQCLKAVEALHSHELKRTEKFEENQLLRQKSTIPIVHPLVDPRTSPVCLITKDPQREYKDLLETHNIKFISRVVGIEKLKGKFKPFEARRMLLKENGMFLADERVVPLLPKLLGSKWFEAKKQPIPVCLTRKDLKGELERAISSTYMNQNQGTCTYINQNGKMSQKPSQILDNIKTAIPAIAKALKGNWDNIQKEEEDEDDNFDGESSDSKRMLKAKRDRRVLTKRRRRKRSRRRSQRVSTVHQREGESPFATKSTKLAESSSTPAKTAPAGKKTQKAKSAAALKYPSLQSRRKEKEESQGSEPSAPPTLDIPSKKKKTSQDEMKQKRSAGAGEKKKEIISKLKGGKSVKNAVLGRKVAQE